MASERSGVSKNEAYHIEVDQYRPPITDCHPTILLLGVTQWVTGTDIDGFWHRPEIWLLKTRDTKEGETVKLATRDGLGGISDRSS